MSDFRDQEFMTLPEEFRKNASEFTVREEYVKNPEPDRCDEYTGGKSETAAPSSKTKNGRTTLFRKLLFFISGTVAVSTYIAAGVFFPGAFTDTHGKDATLSGDGWGYENHVVTGHPVMDNLQPNGPVTVPEYGLDNVVLNEEWVRIIEDGSDEYKYLEAGSAFPDEPEEGIESAHYDEAENTLYLNNCNLRAIETNMMGNGFTIDVSGECYVGYILSWGFYHGGSVTIRGDGKLYVNIDSSYDFGICLMAENSNGALFVDTIGGLTICGFAAAVQACQTKFTNAVYWKVSNMVLDDGLSYKTIFTYPDGTSSGGIVDEAGNPATKVSFAKIGEEVPDEDIKEPADEPTIPNETEDTHETVEQAGTLKWEIVDGVLNIWGTGEAKRIEMDYGGNTLFPEWNKEEYTAVFLDCYGVKDMSYFFYNPNYATELSITFGENFDTSDTEKMNWMFSGRSFETLDLSGWNVSKVTDMSRMFSRCGTLTTLDMSGWDTSNVIHMSRMFQGCDALTALNLSGLNTSNVTGMESMFDGCSALTELNLSGLDTSQVADMSFMFDNCENLTELDLSDWDVSKVINMRSMFGSCVSLTSLNISGWNTASVTNMTDMFEQCNSLTELDVRQFNTSNVTDMPDMFEGCSSLTVLDVSGWNTSNVTDMAGLFADCSSLTALDLSGFDTSNVTDMSRMFVGCSALTALDISGFDTSRVTDMSYMFSYCSLLTNPDVSSFNTANVTGMEYMFKDCQSLTELYIPDWDTSNVLYMCRMFEGCQSLAVLDISGFDTSNVGDMSSMFEGCTSLNVVDVSGFNTSNVTNMSGMFDGCAGLTALNISGWDTSGVTDMGWLFGGCSSIVTLDLSGWDVRNVSYADYMFYDCTGLTSANLSGWKLMTDQTFFEPQTLFENCPQITDINTSGWEYY